MSLIRTHRYTDYEDYINYQKEKTLNKEKQRKWLNEEWNLKIRIFKSLFLNSFSKLGINQTHISQTLYNKYIKKCLCLGSRTGQEVKALRDLGIEDTIGIDLVEFPPYTIKGDIHNLNFENESFDMEFSNIFDHSIYPGKFISEIERTLKPNGICILHIQIDIKQDKYTEIIVNNLNDIEKLFKKSKLIIKTPIKSGIIAMNYELIFKKNSPSHPDLNNRT